MSIGTESPRTRLTERPLVAGLMVLGSAVCFATQPTFAKIAYDHGADPLGLLTVRFAIAGVIVLGIAHLLVRPLRARPEHRPIGLLAVLFTGQAFAFFAALTLTSATLTVLLLYTYPLVVTVASAVLFGERLTIATAGVLAVGLTGIALAVGGVGDDLHVGGIVLALTSGVAFAGVMLISKRVMEKVPVFEMIGLMYLAAVSMYLVVAAFRGLSLPDDGSGWLALAGITTIGTLFAMVLLMLGLDRLPAGTASMLTILEPAVAIALAGVALGEAVSAVQVLGILLVLGALMVLAGMISRGPAATQPQPPPI